MVGIFIRLSLYRRSHIASSFSLDNKQKQVLLVDETRETRQRGGMDVHHHGHVECEFEFEFWPVEHPMEPQDEDRPVKCPMPSASSVINDSRMQEERVAESLRKRGETATEANKEGSVTASMEASSVRAVRKRHHTLTNEDQNIIKPLMRMPPLPPVPTQNITIFEMLQEFDDFES